MKPQTAAYLAAADRAMSNAHGNLSIKIADQAARLAYYAQFHAAQALIFERTHKIAKTHKGVNIQFHRLIKSETTSDQTLAHQLTRAYHFKEVADYETGTITIVTTDDAVAAIAAAEHFVTVIRQIPTDPLLP